MNASEIQSDFNSLLKQYWEVNRPKIRLGIYSRVSAISNPIWGVTKNRIDELRQSGKRWILVLLHESAHKGYLIFDTDIDYYLSTWKLSSDGDYKITFSSELPEPFSSFNEFLGKTGLTTK